MRDPYIAPTDPFITFNKEEIEQSIPDRFEQMVGLYPDRIAVRTRKHAFTYNALNKAANRVAQAILAKRGEEQEPVALLLENDAPTIAAILGTLKAGKIFVTIDPSDARARNAFLVEDSKANLIVTDKKHLSLAEELSQNALQLVNIDDFNTSLSDESPGLSIPSDALAFILYTSGSTGQPKGVLGNHRKGLHQTMTYTNAFHVCKDDRLSLLSSYGSAQATMIMWNALLSGAALYSLDLKEESLAHLAEWLMQEEISIMHVIVTLFRHLISTLTGAECFPKLRLIRIGGSPVSKKDVELFEKHFPSDCRLVNGLSTSETGIISHAFIDRRIPILGSTVPVGYPVDDKEILLFDENGQEVGPNCVGEIAVKSRYLSPGYWRRPDLTRAKYLPDPNGGNERIYLTGDLGRMLPDGSLEYIGRKDLRVKIRGYTVETAEVEMRLLDHAAIKEAAVVAQDDQSGDKRLVAYFVPGRKPAPSISELQSFLKEKLPDYMVPSAFVMLDRLPLTPNGTKVDHRALPAPGQKRPELAIPFVAPRTSIEEKLVRIWSEVLSLDQVGIHDNFLELGGHSLLAMQIIAKINDAFQVDVSVRRFSEASTVEGLAELIENLRWNKENAQPVSSDLTGEEETGEL
jgi:amino acid adenylation domain-containing protein